MSTVGSVYTFQEDLLDACETALATTIGGVPSSSFISPFIPAIDCPPQLTVYVEQLALDVVTPSAPPASAHRVQRGHQVNVLSLAALVVRCIPVPNGTTGKLPSPASISAAAEETSQDLWAVWNQLAVQIRAGSLFHEACAGTYLEAVAPIGASGGTAGWVFRVRTWIDGYEP